MLSVTVDESFDPDFIEVEVKHKKHEFGFGSLVVDDYILDPGFKTYQNIFYEFFNWATVQSYKWKFNKGTRVCIPIYRLTNRNTVIQRTTT